MAGIKVPQYKIFKIGTTKLKNSKWDLKITKNEAIKLDEMIALFEAQEFRLISKILNKPINEIDFSKYIMSVVIDNKSDFKRATSSKGIIVNGINFRRFVGTTGGLKNNTLLFVNNNEIELNGKKTSVLNELNIRCECNRNKEIQLVPAKYEAYKALTCSASQPICEPRRILVVKDCITKFKDTVIYLDNSNPELDHPSVEEKTNMELENTVSDGFNLCTIEYMKKVSDSLGLDYVTSGVCLRNAWLKGMLYPFPIIEFIEKYNNSNYMIEDIWGNLQDIRECDMIITESSLKLWSSYSSIDDYMKSYKENGYGFAVTKISPKKIDDQRELNYQYLQSYNFSDKDIEELCEPTIDYLKKSMGGDYESTIKFLGISDKSDNMSWQKALYTSEYMLGDPYIIDSIHRMIKKKINNAKIGKLIVNGNYQIGSGDPFALMQSICGLEVTGLLKSEECYSKYWIDKNVDELVIFRSPMTSHNNIRKCKCIDNEEVRFWYQYMDTIMIINGWDTFCMAENGCDWDGDILFSTNNKILSNNHVKLPAILCAQQNAKKVIIDEENVKVTNKNGMGNKVGTITNRVTAMMEVLARFKEGTNEYKELQKRIACGQLYQQDELDKIKGIIAKPMPNKWFSIKSCENDFEKSICVDKNPFFMIYVYDDYRIKYRQYIDNCNKKCKRKYGITIDELYKLDDKTEEQIEFLYWYEKKMPFGMSDCSMNKICRYVGSQFEGYKIQLKKNFDFDYNVLKVKRRCTEEHRKELLDLCNEYTKMISSYKRNKSKYNDKYEESTNIFSNDDKKVDKRKFMQEYFYNRAKEICPNDDERLNIILDMCYLYKNNKQFCWDCIGDLICKRLEELNGKVEFNT